MPFQLTRGFRIAAIPTVPGEIQHLVTN